MAEQQQPAPAVPDGAELTFNQVEANGTQPRDELQDGFGNLPIRNAQEIEPHINTFPLAAAPADTLPGGNRLALSRQDGNGDAYHEDQGADRWRRGRCTLIQAHRVGFVNDRVIIKRYSRRGPFGYIRVAVKEIALMQAHGDNVHILRPITVLQDEDYIYMVLPRACAWGSLDYAVIHRDQTLPEEQHRDWVLAVFRKMLRILVSLCEKNICHHDLSAGNFLFLREDANSLVAFDLEFAHRIPTVEPTTGRQLVTDARRFGTAKYLAPEAFYTRPVELRYDGVAIDLWSAAMCLAFMLMRGRQCICEEPSHRSIDQGYYWLILWREQNRRRPSQNDIPPNCRHPALIEKVEAYNIMAATYADDTEVLEGIFVNNPRTRAVTLAQAIQHFF